MYVIFTSDMTDLNFLLMESSYWDKHYRLIGQLIFFFFFLSSCNYETRSCIIIKDLLPCWLYKNDLVKYFMQHIRNDLIIHLTNKLKNNICSN